MFFYKYIGNRYICNKTSNSATLMVISILRTMYVNHVDRTTMRVHHLMIMCVTSEVWLILHKCYLVIRNAICMLVK